MNSTVLYTETRANLIENTHTGSIAVTGRGGALLHSCGDVDRMLYYRSASKPLQALPVLAHGLDEKYGFSPEEIAVFAASHLGDSCHLDAVASALQKCGFAQERLIMSPATGRCGRTAKIAHTCSGKHAALMALAHELCGDYTDYWAVHSAAQQEVLRCIALLAAYPQEAIGVGIDGCGVPVFALPLRNMAASFERLACPQELPDAPLAAAAKALGAAITRCPHMVRGAGEMDSILNADPNLIAKSGKFGVYCIGLRKEELGVAFKIDDGDDAHMPIVVAGVLRALHYSNHALLEALEHLLPRDITNDLGQTVGTVSLTFTL